MNAVHYLSTVPRSFRTMCKDLENPHSNITSRTVQNLPSSRPRGLHQSTRTSKDSSTEPPSSSPSATQPAKSPSNQSFNLIQQIREAPRAVRYTVYAGVALMATAESTFWFNVIKAKFFPSASEEEKEKADQLLNNLNSAVKGFRMVWIKNYGRYYGAYLWGLGYGGIDGLEDR